MASFCEECGTALSDLERFCTHCGTPTHTKQEQTNIGNSGTSLSPETKGNSCPACKHPVPAGDVYCGECGANTSPVISMKNDGEASLPDEMAIQPSEVKLPSNDYSVQSSTCPACNAPIPNGNEFCQECGKRITQAPSKDAEKEASTPSGSEQENKSSPSLDQRTTILPSQTIGEPPPDREQDSASTNDVANRCAECHHPASSDDVFCNECGKRLKSDTAQDNKSQNNQETQTPSAAQPQNNFAILGAIGVLILGAGYLGWHETQKPTEPAMIAVSQPETKSEASNFRPTDPIKNNESSISTSNTQTIAASSMDFLDTPYSKLAINPKDFDNLQNTRCDGTLLADYTIRKTVQERAEGFKLNNFREKNTACHNGAYWGAIAYIQDKYNIKKQQSKEIFLDIWSKKIYNPASEIDIDSAVKNLQKKCPDLLSLEKINGVLFDDNYLRTFMMFSYTEGTPRIDKCGNKVADEGGRQVTQILGSKSKGRTNDRELYIKLADPKTINSIMKNGGARAYLERIKSTPSAAIQ